MSDNNSNVEPTPEVDLDEFSTQFFEGPESDAKPTEKKEEDTPPADEDSDDGDNEEVETSEEDEDTTDDEDSEDDDSLAPEDDDDDEEEEEETPKPKKKNRFQERIDELTRAAREAERERDAVLERLSKLEQNKEPEPKTEPAPEETTSGPSPDDKTDDGEDKYPLGEFDPNYIRDLTRFTIQQEREAAKQQEEQERRQRTEQEARSALEEEWNGKLDSARERYPDLDEKGQELAPAFEGIDPAYGEYLGATLMSLDHGPDVLYYLANHPEEAKAIVASGPQKATLALGRLEARFSADTEGTTTTARPKVTKAPAPPPRNKGSAVAKGRVAPDTDDLDAFEKTFFKKE